MTDDLLCKIKEYLVRSIVNEFKTISFTKLMYDTDDMYANDLIYSPYGRPYCFSSYFCDIREEYNFLLKAC